MNDFVILNGDEQELWEIDYEKKLRLTFQSSI